MKYRSLGKTRWDVSNVGFGGWGIGRTWWGTTDDQESLAALKTALEHGINFFDTAYVYGDGHSERLMAQALSGQDVYIATKIPPKNQGWPACPTVPLEDVFPEDWVVSCTERSLKNLGRETLDLTQFHVWTDAWIDQGWEKAIEKLKSQGKIRAFGVSINDHDPKSALKLVSSGVVDSIQVIFNIFDQSPTEELFPLCKKFNVGVIVRVPFDEGGLTGTLNSQTTFEKGDFRGQYFRGNNLIETVKRVEKIKPLLSQGQTMCDLALQFVLGHEVVSTVIPGMRKSQHVIQNTRVSDQPPLSSKIIDDLKGHRWDRNFYGWWEK